MTPVAAVLRLQDVEKRVNGRVVLKGLTAEFHRGELTVIRAARASGKTTLARLLVGQTLPDTGQAVRAGRSGPIIGTAAGFAAGGSVLRGLDLLAAAYGIASAPLVAAVAACLDHPERLHDPFGAMAGRDRQALIYATGWLIPAPLYVCDGAVLPTNTELRQRLAPLVAAARRDAAIVWIADDRTDAAPYAPDRWMQLADGTLSTVPPEPDRAAERAAARKTRLDRAAMLEARRAERLARTAERHGRRKDRPDGVGDGTS